MSRKPGGQGEVCRNQIFEGKSCLPIQLQEQQAYVLGVAAGLASDLMAGEG
jgi:hypothetical protein